MARLWIFRGQRNLLSVWIIAVSTYFILINICSHGSERQSNQQFAKKAKFLDSTDISEQGGVLDTADIHIKSKNVSNKDNETQVKHNPQSQMIHQFLVKQKDMVPLGSDKGSEPVKNIFSARFKADETSDTCDMQITGNEELVDAKSETSDVTISTPRVETELFLDEVAQTDRVGSNLKTPTIFFGHVDDENDLKLMKEPNTKRLANLKNLRKNINKTEIENVEETIQFTNFENVKRAKLLESAENAKKGIEIFDAAAVYSEFLKNIRRKSIQSSKPVKNQTFKDENLDQPLKYILEWTPSYSTPFFMLQKGRASFIQNNCEFTNCFVTNDRTYLPNEGNFDALLFSSCEINYLEKDNPYKNITNKTFITIYDFPKNRTEKQKYVFVSTEPAMKQLVFHSEFDNFFNWTWTYRLESDVIWKYITVYDLDGRIVGPAINMTWPDKLDPINENLKIRLRSKTKMAAWFVSNCYEVRKKFAGKVEAELIKYGWEVDSFGKCGKYKCGSYKNSSECFRMLERTYYFYFSFENSMDEDYVTEKLMIALDNYAVPVVYGGADYSRFLPPGSFLNARILGPEKLAQIMNDVVKNISLYHDFFRWRNHYKYELTIEGKELCNICTALNNEELVAKKSSYPQLRRWWNQRKQGLYELILAFQKEQMLNHTNLLKKEANHTTTKMLKLINP